MFAPWRVAIEQENGGTRLRCGRDRLEMIAAMLLSSGQRIIVNEPAELRETFRVLAGQALAAAKGPKTKKRNHRLHPARMQRK